jgi:hypothetical protein
VDIQMTYEYFLKAFASEINDLADQRRACTCEARSDTKSPM